MSSYERAQVPGGASNQQAGAGWFKRLEHPLTGTTQPRYRKSTPSGAPRVCPQKANPGNR
jgi:hypothetical protein